MTPGHRPEDGIRPEWLYELVNRVQALGGVTAADCDELIVRELPPESGAESRLLERIIAARKTAIVALAAASATAPAASRTTNEDNTDATLQRDAIYRAACRLRAILDREYSRNRTIDAWAARVGSNRTDLENAFRQLTSQTVHSYVVRRRVAAACHLLHKTGWRVEEIAKNVGYRSKVSLYVNFKRLMGMTPEQYRHRWTFVRPPESVTVLLKR